MTKPPIVVLLFYDRGLFISLSKFQGAVHTASRSFLASTLTNERIRKIVFTTVTERYFKSYPSCWTAV